jgi:NAD-dependent SIR2 family protein deacetylase
MPRRLSRTSAITIQWLIHADLIRAASTVASAQALIVGAGAGMGVDSGLPDFRGPEGFWRAYPAYARLGLRFEELANPRWFEDDPELAWGFYGHRLNLYRRTRPHAGFAILRHLAAPMRHGLFVVTSNVDGQFQRAGMSEERIVEIHGAIDLFQCLDRCGPPWPVPPPPIDVDEATGRARGALPACPRCNARARPNILMFGDGDWDGARARAQEARLDAWLAAVGPAATVILECGAGTAVPSVRWFCERSAASERATLIRINPREPAVPSGHISLPLGALEALTALEALVNETARGA